MTEDTSAIANDVLSGSNNYEFYSQLLSQPKLALQVIRKTIESIKSSDQLIKRVAERSYSHELGFDKFFLSPVSISNCTVRLHVWQAGPHDHVDSIDIHNHGRNFTSMIVTGGYSQEFYLRASEGDWFNEYEYRLDPSTNAVELRDLGRNALRLSNTATYVSGESYELEPHILHRVLPNRKQTTASLVVQGQTWVGFSSMFSKSPKTASVMTRTRTMSESKLVNTLDQVLAAL